MTFALHTLVAALVIAFAAWLSGRFPVTAGFLTALPLATMLVLPLSYLQHPSAAQAVLLARSIFFAVPVSLGFFLPFLFSERLGLSFWQAYALGCLTLLLGFFVHRVVLRLLH